MKKFTEAEKKRAIGKMYLEMMDISGRLKVLGDKFKYGDMEEMGIEDCDVLFKLIYAPREFTEATRMLQIQVSKMKITKEDIED